MTSFTAFYDASVLYGSALRNFLMGASRSCRPWEIAAGHHGRSPLPVRLEHMAVLEKLPLRHRDPFDRLPVISPGGQGIDHGSQIAGEQGLLASGESGP